MSDYILEFTNHGAVKPLKWIFFTEAAKQTIASRNSDLYTAACASRDLISDTKHIQKKQWAALLNCSTTKISGLSYPLHDWRWCFSRYQPDDRVSVELLFCLDGVPTHFDWSPSDRLERVVATEIYHRFKVFVHSPYPAHLLGSLDQTATDRRILGVEKPIVFSTNGTTFMPTVAGGAVPC